MIQPDFGPLTPAALHAGVLLCLEEGIEINFPHEIAEEEFSVMFNKFSNKLRQLEPKFSEEDLYFHIFFGGGCITFVTNCQDEERLLEMGYEKLNYKFQFSPDFLKLEVTLNVEDEDPISTPMEFSKLSSSMDTSTGNFVWGFTSVLPFLIFDKSFFWDYINDSGIANSLIQATKSSISEGFLIFLGAYVYG